jgi:putative protease
MTEEKIGTVTHFFAKPMVAAVRIEAGTLSVGDAIHVRGQTTDLHHRVDSIQIDNAPVASAGEGEIVGIRVPGKVREHDEVFRVQE